MDRDFILRPLMIRCAIGIVQSAYPKWSVHNCVAATENGKNDVLRMCFGKWLDPKRFLEECRATLKIWLSAATS